MILSFIIPVYNTGSYLQRCTDSIINQDIGKDLYEIIIINDGSTDNSAETINQIALDNDVIKVIHSANEGLGAARNKGIRLSVGKYIFFIDPDDYLLTNSLTNLIRLMQNTEYGAIGFNWQLVYADGRSVSKKRKKIKYNRPISGALYLSEYPFTPGACFYIFLGSILKNIPIMMPKGIFHEDELFLPKVFLHAKKILFLEDFVYAYYQRFDSIINSQDLESTKKKISDRIYILDQLICLKKAGTLNLIQKKGLERRIHFLSIDLIINLIKSKSDSSLLKITIGELRNRKLYPLSNKEYGWKYNLFCLVFNFEGNIRLASKFRSLIFK